MKKLVIALLLLSITQVVLADSISDSMANFLGHQGLLVNSTSPSAHMDQSAGHLSLGGLHVNGGNRNVNLIAAQAPSYELGCHKIKLHGGAFSFISSKELVRSLRNVGNGLAAYSAMITLDTLCPVCKKTVDQLNRMAQEVNGWSQNECLMSAQMAGSLWPKTTQSQQNLCEHLGLKGGVFDDYAHSRMGCQDYAKKKELMGRAKSAMDKPASSRNPEEQKWSSFSNLDFGESNIVWRILSQPGFLSNELNTKEMKEFIMTLTGSIIRKEGEFLPLPAMAGNKEFEKALLYGGEQNKIEVWECEVEHSGSQFGCMSPILKKKVISDEKTFVHKIQSQLLSIQNKLINGTELEKSELDLINRTSIIPVAQVLNIQSAYSNAPSILPLHKIADLIAADILASYLSDLLEVVEIGLSKVDIEANQKEVLLSNIKEAKRNLRFSVDDRYQKVEMTLMIAERTERIKQKLNAGFSSHLQQVISTQGR